MTHTHRSCRPVPYRKKIVSVFPKSTYSAQDDAHVRAIAEAIRVKLPQNSMSKRPSVFPVYFKKHEELFMRLFLEHFPEVNDKDRPAETVQAELKRNFHSACDTINSSIHTALTSWTYFITQELWKTLGGGIQ